MDPSTRFVVDVLKRMVSEVVKEVEELPGKVIENFLNSIERVPLWEWLRRIASPLELANNLLALVMPITETIRDSTRRIARIPSKSLVEAASNALRGKSKGRTKVVRADRFLDGFLELTTESYFNSVQLRLPFQFEAFQWIKSVGGKISAFLNQSRLLGMLRGIAVTLWFLIVEVAIATWNWATAIFAIVQMITAIDAVNRGFLEKYTLQQNNPIIKDEKLGRKRRRAEVSAD